MSEDRKSTPQLRFPAFNEISEKKTLGSLCNSLDYGMNASATNYDGVNKYIRITDIDENYRYNRKDLVSPNAELSPDYIVHEGDILLARTGASTGKSYLYTPNDGLLFFAGFLIRASVRNNYNPKFVHLSLQTVNYSKWVSVMSRRSGQPGINANEYGRYELYVPEISEQAKIADFFTLIDQSIVNLEEKVRLLEKRKKGIIQRIVNHKLEFGNPENNQFDKWDTVKVGEIFEITRGRVISRDQVSAEQSEINRHPVYSSQTTNLGIFGYMDTYMFDGNFITWTTDGANAGKVFSRSGKFNCTNVCGLLVEKPKTVGYANTALAEILDLQTPHYVSYVGNPKLMNNVMSEVSIEIPKKYVQKKISILLDVLNRDIEQNTNILRYKKKLKEGLMQKMFI